MTIESLYMNPRPGVTTPEEDPSEWVSATQFPFSSTTLTCVVSGGSAGVKATTISSSASMRCLHASALSLAIILSRSSSTYSGSARHKLRSAIAAFIAIETNVMYSGELCPKDTRS